MNTRLAAARQRLAAHRRRHPLSAVLLDRVTDLLAAGLTPRSEVRLLLKLETYLLRRLAR